MDQQTPAIKKPIDYRNTAMKQDYQFLDSGDGKKLERFGPYILARPASQAVWQPSLAQTEWNKADASFTRECSKQWEMANRLPAHWNIRLRELSFKILPTDFGHLGVFPEHSVFWPRMQNWIARSPRPLSVLNLFAYSGGATLAAAQTGAEVCHVDASKGMIAWAKENAELNQLQAKPIRWITDDAIKFMKREQRRGRKYDAVILDPPTFGRGSRGEVFKIETEIRSLLELCASLLSEDPAFVLFSCHTPGFTPMVMYNLLSQHVRAFNGTLESGEMRLEGKNSLSLPSGAYALWEKKWK